MKTPTLRRAATRPAPALDPVTADTATAEHGHQDDLASWTPGSRLATRAWTVVLWTALACGPVALVGVGAAATAAPPAATPSTATDAAPSDQAAAGEFAQQFVLGWLQSTRGQEDRLSRFVDTSALTLPTTAATATQPATANIVSAGPHTWSVTVAVSVATGHAGTVRRYFQVPVTVSAAGGLNALTLPAPVAAPGSATVARVDYPNDVSATTDVARTVQDFLTALLTDTGDITRYLSPGVMITPISPAPYLKVSLTDLGADQDPTQLPTPLPSGERLRVLATATATSSGTDGLTVEYALTLTSRGGRWETSALDPAPAVSPNTASAAPGTGTGADPLTSPSAEAGP